jgi:hypothetical protein
VEHLDSRISEDAGIAGIAENFHDLAAGLMGRPGIFNDLELHELSRLGIAPILIRDYEVMGRAARLHHPPQITLSEVAPHKTLATPGKNLNDSASPTAAPAAPGQPNRYPIAIEYRTHIRHWKVDVVRPVVGNKKAKPVPVGRDGTRNDVELFAEAILATAIDQQLSSRAQYLQATAEICDLALTKDFKRRSNRAKRQGDARLAECCKDSVGVWNRVPVGHRRSAGTRGNRLWRAPPAPLTHQRLPSD